MNFVAIVLACLACAGQARRVHVANWQEQERSHQEGEALGQLLFALRPPSLTRGNNIGLARQRAIAVNMADDSQPSLNKATTLGAAAVGGLAAVYFTGEVTDAVLWSLIAAYLSTLSNGLGDATRTAGDVAAKVYDKAAQVNEEYDVLPKAKNAADNLVTTADNLNKNYGLTSAIDEKLQLSEKAETLKGKFTDITDKVDDLKSKASSTD
jgi:hypothetical protein